MVEDNNVSCLILPLCFMLGRQSGIGGKALLNLKKTNLIEEYTQITRQFENYLEKDLIDLACLLDGYQSVVLFNVMNYDVNSLQQFVIDIIDKKLTSKVIGIQIDDIGHK